MADSGVEVTSVRPPHPRKILSIPVGPQSYSQVDPSGRGRDVRLWCIIGGMGWEEDLVAKHGLPFDQIPGHVYVLHYEIPQVVRSVSSDYPSSSPIRHYVGWTQQTDPRKRIRAHGPADLREVVSLVPGTPTDEEDTKRGGTCPKCGEALVDSLLAGPQTLSQMNKPPRRTDKVWYDTLHAASAERERVLQPVIVLLESALAESSSAEVRRAHREVAECKAQMAPGRPLDALQAAQRRLNQAIANSDDQSLLDARREFMRVLTNANEQYRIAVAALPPPGT